MDNPKNELANKLKEANNVLVTVSTNPSVDQLAASIGLTLFLSKLKKHATTVFSGQVPSTIEFLKPEQTIENTTDSLRDFIISLDKAKADKIRYKVEDTMVKIFITPYRTSIGEPDLVFSQGDFNVDVVVGLGIHNKDDLDQAITAHGRILHDATVATINTVVGSEMGSLNWVDAQTSSLCEMMVALTDLMKANSLDGQIATAFLTGIVAETERFSNEKTTSTTMNASAKLMAAGANQQLVATQLEDTMPSEQPPAPGKPPAESNTPQDGGTVSDDGALHISHEEPILRDIPPMPEPKAPPAQKADKPQEESMLPAPMPMDVLQPQPQPEEPIEIHTEHREFLGDHMANERGGDLFSTPTNNANMPQGQPGMGGQMSATSNPAMLDQDSPTLNLPQVSTPLLSHASGNNSGNKSTQNQQPQSTPPEPVPPPAPLAPPPPIPEPPAPPPSVPPETPAPSLPPNVQAQPSAALPLPPVPPAAPVAAATEPPPESKSHEPALPKAVIDVMDDRTLKDIEKAVDSPHTTAVGKDMGKKTLEDIEKKVAPTHHNEQLKAAGKQDAPPGGKLPLQYEAIPSEPPEKPKADVMVPKPPQPQPVAAQPARNPAPQPAPQIVGHSGSPVQNNASSQDLDEAKIRARIDEALASSDPNPLPARTDLNAGGELDVKHEDEKDKDKEHDLKPVHIDPTTGMLQYLDDKTLPKDETAASTNDPTAPPPVPPPMSFPQSPGAPGTSTSPVVV